MEEGVLSEVEFVVNSGVASPAIPNTIGPYEARVWNVTDPGFSATPIGTLNFNVLRTADKQTFTVPLNPLLLPLTEGILELQIRNASLTGDSLVVHAGRIVFG